MKQKKTWRDTRKERTETCKWMLRSVNERFVLFQLVFGAGLTTEALFREPCIICCSESLLNSRAHLDDCLLSNGAWPPLAGVEPLFDGEAASMCLEPLNQQVVDSSKVVVAFVLQRLGWVTVGSWGSKNTSLFIRPVKNCFLRFNLTQPLHNGLHYWRKMGKKKAFICCCFILFAEPAAGLLLKYTHKESKHTRKIPWLSLLRASKTTTRKRLFF